MQANPPDVLRPGNKAAKPLRTLLPVFLYFIAAGIATVMLGPLLPALIQRIQSPDEPSPQDVWFEPELIVRESTSDVPRASGSQPPRGNC